MMKNLFFKVKLKLLRNFNLSQFHEHIFRSSRAMYKFMNTGTGNGMQGTQGMGGMLYFGKYC